MRRDVLPWSVGGLKNPTQGATQQSVDSKIVPVSPIAFLLKLLADIAKKAEVFCTTSGTIDWLADRQGICSAEHKHYSHNQTAFLFP